MNRRYLLRACALGLALATPLAAPLATAASPGGDNPGILGWDWEVKALGTQGGQPSYQVTFRARLAEGYIVYGSDFDAELGPRPTKVRYQADLEVKPTGALQSVGTQRRKDRTFNTEYTYFGGTAELAQVVQVPAGATRIAGTIAGQTCYETDGTCTLFSQRFDIPLR